MKIATVYRKTGHVPICPPDGGFDHVPIRVEDITPHPKNDDLYGKIDLQSLEIVALVASIKLHGVLEPLTLTKDLFILSGHRRFAAAKVAGLETVPARILGDVASDDPDCLKLLREFNRQRVKTFAQGVREAVLDANQNPKTAHWEVYRQRQRAATIAEEVTEIELGEQRARAKLSPAKTQMLDAVQKIIAARQPHWPLTDRQIHYLLLNDPPRIHASKPDSIYRNDVRSYKSLTDLLTRARVVGRIPMAAIADPTRPFTKFLTHENPAAFVEFDLVRFLANYRRNLMKSQENHIELIAEKLTVQSALKSIAAEYCLPLTVGRGYASLAPRAELVARFRRSGKTKLVLLFISDLDPEGENIAASFARSLRDDFDVFEGSIVAVKAALTPEQVKRFNIKPMMTAKAGSSRRKGFVAQHGEHVYELEALEPDQLQLVVRETIESVIDRQLFEQEREVEKADLHRIEALRREAVAAIEDAVGSLDDQGEAP